MELPIFCLSLDFNSSGQFGLHFPYEVESNSQDFSYYIPIPISFVNDRPLLHNWESILFQHTYFFPFELDGKYIELSGEFNKNETNIIENYLITFSSQFFSPVTFEVDIFKTSSFYRAADIKTKYLNLYVGKNILLKDLFFIPLIPRDISAMDRIFLEKKGLFLGYTDTTNSYIEQKNLG